jgi:hypothetical protein
VVGVFWGQKYRAQHWHDELCLCVHVKKKLPPSALPESQRLGSPIEGISLDVLEVGAIQAQSVDCRSTVRVHDGPAPRASSLTAVAEHEGGVYALVSGHGTLPYRGGVIWTFYPSHEVAGPVRVDILDISGIAYGGTLVRGRLGGLQPLDMALAQLEVQPAQADFYHLATKQWSPHPLQTGGLQHGQAVRQYSRMMHAMRTGTLRQLSASVAEANLPDGRTHEYSHVLAVDSSDAQPFSRPGDSGSLVTNDSGQVVGTVFAGSGTMPISYVLPIHYVRSEIGPVYGAFFQGTQA